MKPSFRDFFAAIIAAALVAVARVVTVTAVRYAACSPASLAGQSIFFSNHTSHLDFLVLWSSLPRPVRARTRPVAAADYWNCGPVRRLLVRYIFRAVLVQRGKNAQTSTAKLENAEALRRTLAAGDSLVLFPEGTRGDGRSVGSFRSGLYDLAQQWPNVRLIPVHLENLNRVLPKGHVLPLRLPSRLTFGAAIALHDGESKAHFLEGARESVTILKN